MDQQETGAWCTACKGGVHPKGATPCTWNGFSIGGLQVEKNNGIDAKGRLTPPACNQLFGCWSYTGLWGRKGKVAKRAVSGEVSDAAVCSTCP